MPPRTTRSQVKKNTDQEAQQDQKQNIKEDKPKKLTKAEQKQEELNQQATKKNEKAKNTLQKDTKTDKNVQSDSEEDKKPQRGGRSKKTSKSEDKNQQKDAPVDSNQNNKKQKASKAAKKNDAQVVDSPKKKKPAAKDSVQQVTNDQQNKPADSSNQKSPTKQDDSKKDSNIVKKVISGVAPLDEFCSMKNLEVYYDNEKVYDAKLNQSNVSANNNKFYIIQLLKDKTSNTFYFFNRWGRVGVQGQNALKGPLTLDQAKAEYASKLKDKTRKGEYRILDMDYGNDLTDQQIDDRMEKDKIDCPLPTPVKNLIQLIFDMKMMNNQMKEIGYDAKKMPLGKLSKDNISKAYNMLKELYAEVEKSKPNVSVIEMLSNDFYSFIPHDFGFQKMHNFILNTPKKVKDKLEMLESIQNIQIATRLMNIGDSNDQNDSKVNLIHENYKKLKCDIKQVQDPHVLDLIQKYITQTHAKTHHQYKLILLDAFELDREGENDKFTKDIHNKLLLWHGSRLTNYVGIISQGLRIAPPEAPVTGYMFGKGVYFADMVSKSANYCFTSKQNNVGLMILCEVACGNYSDKYQADYYAANLPPGKHSTRGLGRTAPPESSYVDHDEYKIPIGFGKDQVFDNGQNSSLLYNEYIVYNTNQIKMKFLLKIEFDYKY